MFQVKHGGKKQEMPNFNKDFLLESFKEWLDANPNVDLETPGLSKIVFNEAWGGSDGKNGIIVAESNISNYFSRIKSIFKINFSFLRFNVSYRIYIFLFKIYKL